MIRSSMNRIYRFFSILTTLFFFLSAGRLISQEADEYRDLRVSLVEALRAENTGLPERYFLPFADIPRHRFVRQQYITLAYEDIDLPVTRRGIIPSPSLLLAMLANLQPFEGQSVLVVGHGTSYTAAVFSRFYDNVTVVELDAADQERSRPILEELGYENISFFPSLAQVRTVNRRFDAVVVHSGISEITAAVTTLLLPVGSVIVPLAGRSGFQNLIFFRAGNAPVIRSIYESFFPVVPNLLQ